MHTKYYKRNHNIKWHCTGSIPFALLMHRNLFRHLCLFPSQDRNSLLQLNTIQLTIVIVVSLRRTIWCVYSSASISLDCGPQGTFISSMMTAIPGFFNSRDRADKTMLLGFFFVFPFLQTKTLYNQKWTPFDILAQQFLSFSLSED